MPSHRPLLIKHRAPSLRFIKAPAARKRNRIRSRAKIAEARESRSICALALRAKNRKYTGRAAEAARRQNLWSRRARSGNNRLPYEARIFPSLSLSRALVYSYKPVPFAPGMIFLQMPRGWRFHLAPRGPFYIPRRRFIELFPRDGKWISFA